MPPRPILKARLPSFSQRSSASSSSSSTPLLPLPLCIPHKLSPHVHFPPTPSIASFQPTHSSSVYDRSAIAVSPNSCELPERGGRVYSPPLVHATVHGGGARVDSYFDPMACSAEPPLQGSLPPGLIPDLSPSSESDDSDSASPMSFSPNYSISPSIIGDNMDTTELDNIPFSPTRRSSGSFRSMMMITPSTTATYSHYYTQEEFAYALSFLPHPPSLVKEHHYYHHNNGHSHIHDRCHDRSTKMKTTMEMKKRRKMNGARNGDAVAVAKEDEDLFQEQCLDGCLGGF